MRSNAGFTCRLFSLRRKHEFIHIHPWFRFSNFLDADCTWRLAGGERTQATKRHYTASVCQSVVGEVQTLLPDGLNAVCVDQRRCPCPSPTIPHEACDDDLDDDFQRPFCSRSIRGRLPGMRARHERLHPGLHSQGSRRKSMQQRASIGMPFMLFSER